MPTEPAQPAPSSSESTVNVSGLRYGEALDELEELLDELEDAEIDVDRLADRVARGVELVRFCRDRLAVVTTDVDQVVADLLVGDGVGDGDTPGDDDQTDETGHDGSSP